MGYALHKTPEGRDLPWHRVVNAAGRVSPRSEPGADYLQRSLLENEGIAFDASDRLDLERYRWRPRQRRARAQSLSR